MRLSPEWEADLREADRTLKRLGSPARAKSEKAYLKSSLEFYGTGLPAIRGVAQTILKAHRDASREEIRAAVAWLFVGRNHERWTLGCVLLERSIRRLDRRDLPFLETLIRRTRWWNFVDLLAANVAGEIVRADRRSISTLRRWARDPEFWVRRSSILAVIQGVRSGELPFAWLDELATPLLPEREFIIRKAIGWALREVGKTRPPDVERFLAAHISELSPLSFREAVKYLPTPSTRRLRSQFARAHDSDA